MKTKMTFAEKQQEHQYLLDQARQKLETKTIAELKRFVRSCGPRKSTAEPSSDLIVAKEQ